MKSGLLHSITVFDALNYREGQLLFTDYPLQETDDECHSESVIGR
jgi:hypothetical protein